MLDAKRNAHIFLLSRGQTYTMPNSSQYAISCLGCCEPFPCFDAKSDALALLLTHLDYMTWACYLASFIITCHIEDKRGFSKERP